MTDIIPILQDQVHLIQPNGQKHGLPCLIILDAGIKSELIHTERELALLLNQNL